MLLTRLISIVMKLRHSCCEPVEVAAAAAAATAAAHPENNKYLPQQYHAELLGFLFTFITCSPLQWCS
jgi:hypothetical protein